VRWLKAAGWLVVAVALIFLQDVAGWASHGFGAMPAMVTNLTGDESDFSDKLDAAVKSRFPLGSDEQQLVASLKAEGFTPDWRERDAPNAVSFVRDGLVCKKVARVTWQADHGGRLTEVAATYASQCSVSSPYTQSAKSRSKTS
jgi:hypothetical protein